MMKRKRYPEEDLKKAISSVRANHLSVSKAAQEFKIPRKTLEGHVKGTVASSTPGPERMITMEEEEALVNYIKYMAERGFPITRKMLKCYTTSIVKQAGRSNTTLFNLEQGPSDKWIKQFIERHPEISPRCPEIQDRARARMSNTTVLEKYFDLLSETIKELGLQGKPNQIFNCDETGFSNKESSREKVLALKGAHSYLQNPMVSSHITANVCVSADGSVLPTFLIFEGGLPHRQFKDGVPDTWLFGTSETGYIDSELFQLWFEHLFIPFCGSHRPVLLVLDNHDTHINIPLIEKAKENDIHILGLPPHTTHILQPLDVSIFGPLKTKVRSLAVSLTHVNSSTTIGKAKFPAILSTAIDNILSPGRVKAAFKRAGLYPVDITAIDHSQVMPSDLKTSTAATTETNQSSSPGETTILCHSCGTALTCEVPTITNPLVSLGLIPESLASILVPPSSNQTRKSKKIVTESRVITGNDMLLMLQEKSDMAKRQEEEKEKRKIERTRKREENERLKQAKQLEREQKKAERERKKVEKEKERASKRERRDAVRNRRQREASNSCEAEVVERTRRERQNVVIDEFAMNVDEDELVASGHTEIEVNETVLCLVCGELETDGDSNIEWVQCDRCDGWVHLACTEVNTDEAFVCYTCGLTEE